MACLYVCPSLAESVQRIRAVSLQYDSPREKLFAAFLISGRGSLREAPNVSQSTSCLKRLSKHGDNDPAAVLSKWNKTRSIQTRVVGQRAGAVRMLLEVKEELYKEISETISEFGWSKFPYSEEVLASKKNYEGRHRRPCL